LNTKSRNGFIVMYGIGVWGGLMFLGMNAVYFLTGKDITTSKITEQLVVSALITPLMGAGFGLALWKRHNRPK
jgi:hypothetical protein